MRSRLLRAASLSRHEWLVLSQLLVAAAVLAATLRLASLDRVVGALRRASGSRLLGRFPLGHRALSRSSVVVLADRAARVASGDSRCLLRSLLLLWTTWARGEPARMSVGAARAADGRIAGHAWVEDRHGLMADSPALTAGYATFLRFPER